MSWSDEAQSQGEQLGEQLGEQIPAPDSAPVDTTELVVSDTHSVPMEATDTLSAQKGEQVLSPDGRPLPRIAPIAQQGTGGAAQVVASAVPVSPEAQSTSAPASPARQVTQAAVSTAKQATQTAVSTAKQATQQVAAAVQQQAQKVTVAPRKAIYRGRRFLFGYAALTMAFGVLAMLARRYKYFPADVGITRAVQSPDSKAYDEVMHLASQLGWQWNSVAARAATATLMWASGFRMESAFTVSTWSGDLLTMIVKSSVLRPRPTRDLVRVASQLGEASFPSGHVVHYVTFYGFLFYLVFTHLKRRWFRGALLTLLAGLIALVGPSRIYMGHHWPSDVAGAYFVGTLWLGAIIIAYLETKANYTLHTHPPFFVKRPQQLGK